MLKKPKNKLRVFKTAWFAKAAKKASITDVMLCRAIAQVMKGQADDLGAGVYKKRLNDNLHRSIILAKAGQWWIYQYLFAKQDRANIHSDELAQFRALAKVYAQLTQTQLDELIADKEFLEVCHDQE
jgi:hypothetical protein